MSAKTTEGSRTGGVFQKCVVPEVLLKL